MEGYFEISLSNLGRGQVIFLYMNIVCSLITSGLKCVKNVPSSRLAT